MWLKIRDTNHIATDGIYVTTKENNHDWKVAIDTELNIVGENKESKKEYIKIETIEQNIGFRNIILDSNEA